MRLHFIMVMAVKLALLFSFLQGAEPGVCPAGTISMNVATISELQTLMTAIKCTGEGVFNVTWIGHVSLVEAIEIRQGKKLTVTGSTSALTDFSSAVIDAGGATGIFTVYNESMLSLNSLVLQGGSSTNGTAVDARLSSSVIVHDCVFTNFVATNGGAIYAESSEVFIRGDTAFVNNSAEENGGAVYAYGNCSIDVQGNTYFNDNTAALRGGAVYVKSSDMYISGSNAFFNNSADHGGAIHISESHIDIIGKAIFAYNLAENDGGALYASDATISITGSETPSVDISGSEGEFSSEEGDTDRSIIRSIAFFGNSARVGGAMHLANSEMLQVSSITFEANEAVAGGAIYTTAVQNITSKLTSCVFQGNHAVDGGAVFFSAEKADEYITSSVFRDNLAEFSGGAIFHTGFLRVINTTFTANRAGSEGLAIVSDGYQAALWNVSFSENSFYCRAGEYSDVIETKIWYYASCFSTVCDNCVPGAYPVMSGEQSHIDGLPICETAPAGSSALSSGTTMSTLVINKGYYRTSNRSTDIRECFYKKACHGGRDADRYCATGYKGPYCAVCDDGFTPVFNFRCKKCLERESLSTAILAGVVVFVILASGVVLSYLRRVPDGEESEKVGRFQTPWRRILTSLHKTLEKGWPSSALKITVVLWQILSQFAVLDGKFYTQRYANFISIIRVVNVDFGYILSFACILRLNFYKRLVFATVGPLAVLLVLGCAYGLTKRNDKLSESALRVVRHRFISAATFVMVFVYASVTFTVLQIFSCELLDDGIAYLGSDYSISCSTTLYKVYVAYAFIMLGIYTFGIPSFFLWWLICNRRDLKSENRHNIEHLQPFSNIWVAYTPSKYYYEVVECARRVLFAGSATFGSTDNRARAVSLLVNTLSPLLLDPLHPFDSGVDMALYRCGNGIVFGSIILGAISTLPAATEAYKVDIIIWVLSDALLFANLAMVATVVGQGVFLMMKSS